MQRTSIGYLATRALHCFRGLGCAKNTVCCATFLPSLQTCSKPLQRAHKAIIMLHTLGVQVSSAGHCHVMLNALLGSCQEVRFRRPVHKLPCSPCAIALDEPAVGKDRGCPLHRGMSLESQTSRILRILCGAFPELRCFA